MFRPETLLSANYQITGSERDARERAERICLDQTIEADEDVLPADRRPKILGHIAQFRAVSSTRFEVNIVYQGTLVGSHCSALLNLLYGTTSLRAGIRLLSFALGSELLARWHGPRFGLETIRQRCMVAQRALVCGVLKPLGRTPEELAHLASEFVRGGVDLVKDDQGLLDQPFCSFSERVKRCAEAINHAAHQRARPCLYFPHISGPLDVMRSRAHLAKYNGAHGLLIAPGLTGFDALSSLATDDTLMLPIISHPSFLGSYCTTPDNGLAPSVLFGQICRVAGSDVSVYPSMDSGYPMMQADYLAIAQACRSPWGNIKPTLPTAAGRISVDRVRPLIDLVGSDVLFILGSRIQQDIKSPSSATKQFMDEIKHRTTQ